MLNKNERKRKTSSRSKNHCLASEPILASKTLFYRKYQFSRGNTRKSYFHSKIVKGNTFDMFPPFLHCLAQKRSLESGRYSHLKSQASEPILASKTLFYRKYQFSRGNTRKSNLQPEIVNCQFSSMKMEPNIS